MPDADVITVYLTGVQVLVVVASVVYLSRQVRGERVAAGFQAYSHINDSYMRHLWLASDNPELNCIWEQLDDGRRSQLDDAQRSASWGAWHAMTHDEKRCYRYTRSALEIFEQAWEVRRRDMIGEDTWHKWEETIVTWAGTRYFGYVFEDSKPRLIAQFCVMVAATAQRPASRVQPASSQ